MKILVLGYARHGKDTLGDVFFDEFGVTSTSSSEYANMLFIFDKLHIEHGYINECQCFEDRVNHRKLWYDLICEYNQHDKARLAKEIVDSHDCYLGMRDYAEFKEVNRLNLFDLIIWVDASERLPLESRTSIDIPKHVADIIIENNTTEEDFIRKIKNLGSILFKK